MSNADPLLVLKALADPVRWQLVKRLALAPQTTGVLASGFDLTRFAVMKHLAVLVESNLVTIERRGRERWNHLNPVVLAQVLENLTTPLGRTWTNRLVGLRNAVEAPDNHMNAPVLVEIRQQIRFSASQQRVYDALTRQIDLWWTSPYRMTEGGRISLDTRMGGELREENADGHVCVWGRVDECAPARLLGMSGTFGMLAAISGRVRFELTPFHEGTTLTLTHIAVGAMAGDTQTSFMRGWSDLLDVRLRARLESP